MQGRAMRVDLPDPSYTASPRAAQNLLLAFRLALLFTAVLWVVFLVDHLLHLDLVRYGLMPRRPAGLLGVLTTPVLHGSFGHLVSNTVPLLVGGTALLFLYPNSALRVFPVLYLGTPLIAWTFARPDLHVGASGLIYGMLAYVFVSGLVRRDVRSIGVSLLIYFLYGSMLYGIVPGRGPMSWELHLSGALLGAILSFVYRRWDRPPRKHYEWEDEEGEPPDSPPPGR